MAAEGRALTAREARERRIVLPAVLRGHWAVLLVLAAFAGAAFIVPTLMPVAVSDDWTYARSAQILLAEGRLTVFPIVVATAIFPIAWGALFGFLFGPELGVFRLSTVVITVLGGLALYDLCRDLGVNRARGALGVAAFLFNPLVFVLAYSFMTDAHFTALLVMATWMFVRAIGGGNGASPALALTPSPSPSALGEGSRHALCRPNFHPFATSTRPLPRTGEGRGEGSHAGVRANPGETTSTIETRFLLAGSAISSLAFLTRHQGILIIAAVGAYLLLSRRLRWDWASVRLLAAVTAIPLLTMAGYGVWLQTGDTAAAQGAFLGEVLEERRLGRSLSGTAGAFGDRPVALGVARPAAGDGRRLGGGRAAGALCHRRHA